MGTTARKTSRKLTIELEIDAEDPYALPTALADLAVKIALLGVSPGNDGPWPAFGRDGSVIGEVRVGRPTREEQHETGKDRPRGRVGAGGRA